MNTKVGIKSARFSFDGKDAKYGMLLSITFADGSVKEMGKRGLIFLESEIVPFPATQPEAQKWLDRFGHANVVSKIGDVLAAVIAQPKMSPLVVLAHIAARGSKMYELRGQVFNAMLIAKAEADLKTFREILKTENTARGSTYKSKDTDSDSGSGEVMAF